MKNNSNRVNALTNLVCDVLKCAQLCVDNYDHHFPDDEDDISNLNSCMQSIKFEAERIDGNDIKEINGINFGWYLVYGSNNSIRDKNIIITSDYEIEQKLLNITYHRDERKLNLELHIHNDPTSSNDVIDEESVSKHWPTRNDIISIVEDFWDYYDIHNSKLVQDISDKLLASKNIIIHGAPGTGKTYLSKLVAAKLIGTDLESLNESDQFGFVQFHPSYDYTDFMEGLRPTLDEDQKIKFTLQPGIFERFVAKACQNSDKKYIFVIDEINRGEISKILGELFYALDPGYRGKKGTVETQYSNLHSTNEFYKKDYQFYIPNNLYLIGTMNDIDRSVDSFDFATRRRFRFIKLEANDDEVLAMLNRLDSEKVQEAKDRLKALNEKIMETEGLSEDYQIGPSYFLNLPALKYDYEVLWSDYLKPLLEDYLFENEKQSDTLDELKKAYDNGKNEN